MSFALARRRVLLSLCAITSFLLWYSGTSPPNLSPKWNVVDFTISRHADTRSNVAITSLPLFQAWENTILPDRNAISATRLSYHERLSNEELRAKVQYFIQWDRPSTSHWPAWHDYDQTDYDPNRWEGMDREYGYFFNDSVQDLEKRGLKATPYLPYPDYSAEPYKKQWHGTYQPCRGPDGKIYGEGGSSNFVVHAYERNAGNFPRETLGSTHVLGLDDRVCFDQFSRYQSYGLVDPSGNQEHHQTHKNQHVPLQRVRWGALQDACFEDNANRFEPSSRVPMVTKASRWITQGWETAEGLVHDKARSGQVKRYKPRTAILIRTWEGYKYRDDDIHAIRALITETALLSGGEYQVFLFVNIKQPDADIYGNPQLHQELLKRNVPRELRDMAILWTEEVCEEWYPHVGDWQVYWMQFMSLQWFSKQHPEFDYVWNWETDARYVGNHYHFLEQISRFARTTPRKHLWERNARFYFRDYWDGDYEAFLADTDQQILNASAQGWTDEPIWGPRPYAPFQYPVGPKPPRPQEDDNFEWGVGEEADLITLQPIWDPSETEWSYRNHIWNFVPEVRPHFTSENRNADGFDHHGFPAIPRRVFINTVVRFSRRLLHVMHLENLQGRSMQAEMWPATVALQHGLKAVYAPHPIWTDRRWPGWYAEAVFNANDGIASRWGQQLDSPYNHDREANFGGWSWYYRSLFPNILYRRWHGWKAKDWGWDAHVAQQREKEGRMELASRLGRDVEEMGDPRMCLPGMLLHPVKNVYEDADS